MMATESVWDYPRPPRVEPATNHIRIIHKGVVIADSSAALRVLETSHPPAYYIPETDIRMDLLTPARARTFCEWKGQAHYYDLSINDNVVPGVAWTYPRPNKRYDKLTGHLAFYAQKLDACFVDDEQVKPQEGVFYGGWVTSNITGPFKGAPGTSGW